MRELLRPYMVVRRQIETPSVATLCLAPKDGPCPDFIPGQFINIRFPGMGAEAKSYTISSIPSDTYISVSVRAAGSFSTALAELPVGGQLLASEPYGYFYPEESKAPRVFLAGGIGITPFVSMMRAGMAEGAPVPTLLLYSNRSGSDVAFRRVLEKLAFESAGAFSVRHFLTRDGEEMPSAARERIGIAHLQEAAAELPGARYFLCGSISFVRDMRLILLSLRLPETGIFTEAFY